MVINLLILEVNTFSRYLSDIAIEFFASESISSAEILTLLPLVLSSSF